MDNPREVRPIRYAGRSQKDLFRFPEAVRETVAFALALACEGKKHDQAKPLKGFGSATVLEVVEDHRGNTYRAVYTVRFAGAVYVLHAFQKRSKHGIATPKHDIDLIKERLKWAAEDYSALRRYEG
ncbi:MAG: type II toxin-antitoxin system RelE/ParE family toxin [Candidatus Hydrogenedentes bacterium]|nr:type II toxin-antitoxin system RelE/ParE family toxin [Candidatus Hydrogenedentota bacterium]